MAITKGNILTWEPTVLEINGVDYGALKDCKFKTDVETKDVEACNANYVIKKRPNKFQAWLEFGALEINLTKLTAILSLAAGGEFGTARELTEYSCTLTITLSNGSLLTLSGNVTYSPAIEMDLTVKDDQAPTIRVDFMPDLESSGRLFTLVSGGS